MLGHSGKGGIQSRVLQEQTAKADSAFGMEAPSWVVENALESNGFRLELRRYAWPRPNEFIHQVDRPVFGFVVDAEPFADDSRPLNSGRQSDFSTFGNLSFTPANVPFEVRGSGGDALLMAFEVPQLVLDRLLPGADWDMVDLRLCSNIRDSRIDVVLERLLPELRQPGFASDIMLEAAGMMISAQLARFLMKPRGLGGNYKSHSARQLSRAEVDKITGLVENENAIPLETIAKECGFSVRTLTRNFKATTGLTISSFIAEMRIQRAREALATTSKPLKVIAWETGFATASSFASAFRRETGMTPGEYRNQCGK